MWMLFLAASAYPADTSQRTDPVGPACLQRDAPADKCVIDDGPPLRPRAAGQQAAQTPVTPPASPSVGGSTDGGGQKAPPKAKTLPGAHK
jgi:hypothetical protein